MRARVRNSESAAEVISLRRASAGDLRGGEFESHNICVVQALANRGLLSATAAGRWKRRVVTEDRNIVRGYELRARNGDTVLVEYTEANHTRQYRRDLGK